MTRPLLEVHGVSRSFPGGVRALREVGFTAGRGEIIGVLGENGAGKSTLLRIIAGVLAPSDGRVLVDGHDVVEAPLGARSRVGYLPDGAPLVASATVAQTVGFVARVHGAGDAEVAHSVDRICRALEIADLASRRVGTLSRGQRQRVGLAAALVHDPAVLLLDEPVSGLDPSQVALTRSLLRARAADAAVVVSTHRLEEVRALCDRVLFLRRGVVVADTATARLARAGHDIEVAFGAGPVQLPRDRIVAGLRALPGVMDVVPLATTPGEARFLVTAGQDVRAGVYRWASGRGLVLVELAPRRLGAAPLEAAFRALAEDPS